MDKKYWKEKLRPYTIKSNRIAAKQVVATALPYMLIWFLYIKTLTYSAVLVIPYSLIMSLIVLRFFVLMHDCGHNSFFSSTWANKCCGFILGVITGMPQFVWSKHHAFHHKTNGDWQKYQGPLSTISTKQYDALSERQQKFYKTIRHPSMAIFAGFYYILFNPRFTWFIGSIHLIVAALFSKNTFKTLLKCESKYWKTPKEYLHMSYNNIVLISLWAVMCLWIGVEHFFIFYSLTLSLAGGLGIIFFTLQHNFEHSYASDSARVDYFQAALEGTSYLKLSPLMNWFTADIAYHHIHHLSTSVPNYRLADCQRDLKALFKNIKRITFNEMFRSLSYLLWDSERQMIISIAEYQKARMKRENRILGFEHH